ncbi:alcohol acetyltransferase [Mycena latifolia]|nr:alcohol acetyltransferase [Mycena latifolia]
MPDQQRLRRLGVLERYHATRHFLGMDGCVVTSARYTTQANPVLTKDVLFPALRLLIETEPMLGVCFDGREDRLDVAFLRLGTVDLSRVVEFSGNPDLQDALEKQLSRTLEDTVGDMPLWRLEVLADNTVIVALHHAIGDGLSTAAFHRLLIRALNQVNLPPSAPSVPVPDLPLLPPIEDATDVRPSLFLILSVLFPLLLPKSWTTAYSAWTGHPVPTVTALQTHVRMLTFDASDAKKFADICRAHKASVSSGLYELAVCVLSRMLASANAGPAVSKTISVNVSASLRGAAGKQYEDDVLCDYAASYHSFPPVHTEFSWQRAARVAADFQVQKIKCREYLGMLGWIEKKYVEYMRGQLGEKRAYGLLISNLGRFTAPVVDGEWSVNDVRFFTCDSLAGPAVGMNVVGDAAGGLNISFTWGEKGLDSGFIDAFIPMFRESFHNLLKQ